MEKLLMGIVLVSRPRDFVSLAVASRYTGHVAEELLKSRAWVTKVNT